MSKILKFDAVVVFRVSSYPHNPDVGHPFDRVHLEDFIQFPIEPEEFTYGPEGLIFLYDKVNFEIKRWLNSAFTGNTIFGSSEGGKELHAIRVSDIRNIIALDVNTKINEVFLSITA